MTITTTRRDPFAISPPSQCILCRGGGCPACDHSGTEAVWFKLPPMRTAKYRHAIYRPSAVKGEGRLKVRTSRKPDGSGKLKTSEYTVCEFSISKPGRAFALLKDGERSPYHVWCGPQYAECSCDGGVYASADKANRRAWEAGEGIYPTAGCVHSDAVLRLLAAGYFGEEGGK